MAETIGDLVLKIGADTKELHKGLKEMETGVKERTDSVKSLANNMSMAFVGVAAAISGVIASTVRAAAEEQKLTKTFENMYHSAKMAADVIDYIGNFSMSSAFSGEQIEQAAISLAKFGIDVQETLPLISDLAAKTGKSIDEVAAIYTKVASGSQRAGIQLKNELGISTAELKKFGVAISDNGKISANSAEEIQRNLQGVNSYIKATASGASENLSETVEGRMTSIKNSVQEIKEDIGAVFLPAVDAATKKVLELTKSIKDMSPAQKEQAMSNVAWAGGITIAVAGFVKLTEWISKVTVALPILTRKGGPLDDLGIRLMLAKDAITNLSAGVRLGIAGILITALTGIAIGALRATNELNNAKWAVTEFSNECLKQGNLMIGLINTFDLLGKSAKESAKIIKDYGMDLNEVIKAQKGMEQMYSQAAVEGDFLSMFRLDAKIKKTKEVRAEMDDKKVKSPAEIQQEQSKKDLQEKIKSIEADYQATKAAEDKGYQQEKAMREKILVLLTNAAANGANVKDLMATQEKKYNDVLAKIYKEGISNLKDSFQQQLNAKEDFIQRTIALGQMDEAEQQKAYKRVSDWITKFRAEHKAELAKNPDLLKVVTDAEQKITIDSYNARKAENQKYYSELEKTQNLYINTVKANNRNNVQAEIDAINTVIENYRLAMKRKPAIHKEATDKIKEYETSLIELTKQREDQEAALAEKRMNAAKETLTVKIEALAKELESGKDTSGQILQLVQERMKLEFDLIDQKAKREVDSYGNTEEAKKTIMLETANFKAAIIKQEVDYIKSLIKNTGGDLTDLEYRLKGLLDSYEAVIKNGKTPEGAQMKLGVQQINETAAYLRPVQNAADSTATAINSLGSAANASSKALQQQAGSYGYSPTGGAFKQLSGFGTGTGGAFPSMSGFSGWIGVPDISIPGIDMSPSKNPSRNLWKEMSRPNYGLLNPDGMQPNAYFPATQQAKGGNAAGEFSAAVKEFAAAVRNINVNVNVQGGGSSGVSAGQSAVAKAAQTNYDPNQSNFLDSMPTIGTFPTVSIYGLTGKK